jgi:Phosphodiester glycosidase
MLAAGYAGVRPATGVASAGREYRRIQLTHADDATSTLHAAYFDRGAFGARVTCVGNAGTLVRWCRETGVRDAIVGGFFARPQRTPLGELRMDGRAVATTPFYEPWAAVRSCVHIWGNRIRIARRFELAAEPPGDLLQAGPLLVRDGLPVVTAGEDSEGFSAGAAQFDSDITRGRYPRAALALTPTHLMAVACEGRALGEAGMTLTELAKVLAELGAETALNLDGGGSASLVYGGRLRNCPREEHGIEIVGGRPIATALVFERASWKARRPSVAPLDSRALIRRFRATADNPPIDAGFRHG